MPGNVYPDSDPTRLTDPGPGLSAGDPTPVSGTPLGSAYLLHEVVGVGATGTVHRGTRRDTGDVVAVKVLRPELARDPEVVARFVQERSILLDVDHPNLVRVRDLVVEGSTLAIVMDYVAGGNLRDLLRRQHRLPPAEAGELVAEALDGLGAAHALGIVHRDLKPENILLERSRGGRPTARVTDFGIARLAHGPSFTRLSGVVGTPDYMAPEAAVGGPQTFAVDLYAAGVLAYELMTGTTPFPDRHPVAVVRAHIDEEPTQPAGLPDRAWAALRRLLAKDPADRPPGAVAAASDLRQASAGLIEPLGPDAGASPVASQSAPTIARSHGSGGRPPGRATAEGATAAGSGRGESTAAPGRLHRTRLVPALLGVAIIAAGIGFFTLRGSGGSGGSTSYGFPPVQYPDGLVAARLWTLSPSGAFAGTVSLSNATTSTVNDTVQETIPKAVAGNADKLTFEPPPSQVVSPDPVVAYDVTLAPGGSSQFTYTIHKSKKYKDATATLRSWATKVPAPVGPTPTSGPLSAVAKLASLTVPLANLSLNVGQSVTVPIAGTMSDGSVASAAVVGALVWSSSDPSVATVDAGAAGQIKARSPGTATIAAQSGAIVATTTVTVGVVPPRPSTVPRPYTPLPVQTTAAPPAVPTQPAQPSAQPPPSPAAPSPQPSPSPSPATLPPVEVYRVNNPDGDFYYSSSLDDIAFAEKYGWSASTQVAAFYGCQGANAVYMYRLYGAVNNVGVHVFTTSESENQAWLAKGFAQEPASFQACTQTTPGALPVYRLTNSTYNTYLLTVSATEVAAAEKAGWVYVGIGFYALPPPGFKG